jgi:uncharacterized OB-fold protein
MLPVYVIAERIRPPLGAGVEGLLDVHRPRPIPSPLTEGFWAAASRHELAIQRCRGCKRWFHPPVPVCSRCHSEELDFEQAGGRGTIYAYTVMNDELVPGFESVVPLAVVVVELDEQEGLMVVSNLIGTEVSELRIGDRVQVTFEELPDGGALPQFRPCPRERP